MGSDRVSDRKKKIDGDRDRGRGREVVPHNFEGQDILTTEMVRLEEQRLPSE